MIRWLLDGAMTLWLIALLVLLWRALFRRYLG